MIIMFYDCIVCKKKVGCEPFTPLEERCCNTHTKEEILKAQEQLKKLGEGK